MFHSYRLLQQLPVFFEPGLCLFHIWRLGSYDVPESRRMVALHEVGQFVNNDVVNDEHGGLDQTPIEIDVVLYRAGTPSIAIVHDFDLTMTNT